MALRHENVLSNIGKSSDAIGVPVLVNTSAVKKGDELTVDMSAVAASTVVGQASASAVGASTVGSSAGSSVATTAPKRKAAVKGEGRRRRSRRPEYRDRVSAI